MQRQAVLYLWKEGIESASSKKRPSHHNLLLIKKLEETGTVNHAAGSMKRRCELIIEGNGNRISY
ncbi:hypothetical protein G9A89_002021 [Geosiphon pyriformis]|nr:hypothetical protein G9A89_002021 [Geosiphon pyriformis]